MADEPYDITELRRRLILSAPGVLPEPGGAGGVAGGGHPSAMEPTLMAQNMMPLPPPQMGPTQLTPQPMQGNIPTPPSLPDESPISSSGVTAPSPVPAETPKGPAQQALEAALAKRPQESDPQFHQGRWRTFGNVLASGLAGLQSPAAGIATADALKHGPYERAVKSYEGNVAALQPAATAEQARGGEAIKRYEAETGRAREINTGELYRAHEELYRHMATKPFNNPLDKKIGEHIGPGPDGKDHQYYAFTSTNGEMYKVDAGPVSVKEGPEHKPTEAEREGILTAKGDKRTPAENKELQVLVENRSTENRLKRAHATQAERPPYFEPGDVEKAQTAAATDVIRARPEFAPFYDADKRRILTLDEVTHPSFLRKVASGAGVPGVSATVPNADTLKIQYNRFLGAIQAQQRTYESTEKGKGASTQYSEVK